MEIQKRSFKLTTTHQLAPVVLPYILLLIASIAVILRFWARRIRKAGYGVDDWLVLLAITLSWPYQVSNTLAFTEGGAGVPLMVIMQTQPQALAKLTKAITASNIVCTTTITILQISVLFFYLRMFGVCRWLRYSAITLIIVCFLYWASYFIAQLLTCRPLSKFWTPTKPGSCMNQYAFCAAEGLIHVILDFAVLLLPMPMIWRLHISFSSKIILSILFAIGTFASIASLIKLTCLIPYSFINIQDLSGSIWYSILMQAIETPLGIICVCVPTLPPVWAVFKQSKPSMYAVAFFSSVWSRSNVVSKGPSSKDSRTAKFSSPKDFQRLDGSYAANVNALKKGSGMSQEDIIPLNDIGSRGNDREMGFGSNTIKVEQSWIVDQ